MKNSYDSNFFLFFVLFFAIFAALLSNRDYFPESITIDVPQGAERLYFDIGYGYHEFFSEPVEDGKTVISPHRLNIGLIKSFGIKTPGFFKTAATTDDFSMEYGTYQVIPFNPFLYGKKGVTVKRKLVLFWALVLSSAITLAVWRWQSVREFINVNRADLYFLLGLFSFYGLIAWILYPTISHDSTALGAYIGQTNLLYSGLYVLVADSAYLLFGDALVGLLFFQVICMAIIMLYALKSLRLCGYESHGKALLLLMAVSPLVYTFLSLTEYFETSAMLAVLSLVLAVYSILAGKKWFSKTFLAACLCALGATMMRGDFAGYFAGILLLRMSPWRISRVVPGGGVVIFIGALTVCAVVSGWLLGSMIDHRENIIKLKQSRERCFWGGNNLGYIHKYNLLTEQEKMTLEPYYDSKLCGENWDVTSWRSYTLCCSRSFKGDRDEAMSILMPMAQRVLRENPSQYFLHRWPFVKSSLNTIFGFSPGYLGVQDDFSVLARFLADPTKRFIYTYEDTYDVSLRRICLSPSPLRKIMNHYLQKRKIAWAFLIVGLFSGLALSLRYSRETKQLPPRHITWLTVGCLALGPLTKFSSIVLLAPALAYYYFNDITLLFFCISPIFLALLVPLSQSVWLGSLLPPSHGCSEDN